MKRVKVKKAGTVVIGRKIAVSTVIDRHWWSRSLAMQAQQPIHSRLKSFPANVIDLRSYFK